MSVVNNAGSVVTVVLDLPVAFETQSEKIVVLADYLTGRTRKVQREGRHIAAQVVDVKNQLFRQVRMVRCSPSTIFAARIASKGTLTRIRLRIESSMALNFAAQ
jgi:hypothetical protein